MSTATQTSSKPARNGDSAEILVEVKGLKKTYESRGSKPVHAVKGVDLTINRGEIFSLLGPNGAGKTTTISMMCGLIAPSEGDALIASYSITRQPMQAKRLIGVVPQEIALYPTLTPRQNLRFFGQMADMGGATLNKRIDEVLEFIDLRDRANDRVDTFSGGMKRRLNIGIGLLHQPELIYMDEPTVGIDPQSRRRILDTVSRLSSEYGMTVLYTTHLMEEAQELSQRVGIMDHGQIIALGTQGELIQQVGEEDRLIFNMAAQPIPDAILRRIEAEVPGVTSARYDLAQTAGTDSNGEPTEAISEGAITIHVKRGRKALPQIINVLNDADLETSAIEVREPDLEAVFLHLTGRALRD